MACSQFACISLCQGDEGVAVMSLPGGQTLQVQGVIQTTQPSVIQSPQMQTAQVATHINTFLYKHFVET